MRVAAHMMVMRNMKPEGVQNWGRSREESRTCHVSSDGPLHGVQYARRNSPNWPAARKIGDLCISPVKVLLSLAGSAPA